MAPLLPMGIDLCLSIGKRSRSCSGLDIASGHVRPASGRISRPELKLPQRARSETRAAARERPRNCLSRTDVHCHAGVWRPLPDARLFYTEGDTSGFLTIPCARRIASAGLLPQSP